MPYVSEKQRRYFHANREKLESQGVDVGEYDRETKRVGMKGKKAEGAKKPRPFDFKP
jgi:hypothetical protein